VAGEGGTPGWNIEYLSGAGELNAVEVEATTASTFLNFEPTAGELSAARKLGEKYWVYLVSDCLTARPRLQIVKDPAGLLSQVYYELSYRVGISPFSKVRVSFATHLLFVHNYY
jgi:hypothetical protein